MFNRYLFSTAFFVAFLVFGQQILPGSLVQDFKSFQSIFWQIISAAVLGFVLANTGRLKLKRKGKFKVPHLRF